MADASVTISEDTLDRLRDLAQRKGLSLEQALELAVKDQHDRAFWDAVDAGYAALRADPAAWAEVESERKVWEGTLLDGLDRSERWATEGDEVRPPTQEKST